MSSLWPFIEPMKHRLCETDICQIDYIRTLDENLSLYLNALSKVFFKKENMRIKETWSLSTFYSFAIQALVRQLIRHLSFTANSEWATDQYLHLAIRLFIASSGDYDPLMRDYVSLSKGKEVVSSYVSDLQEAKDAVEQDSWGPRGILSSADYLRDLFEDKGGNIKINNVAAGKRDIARKAEIQSIDNFLMSMELWSSMQQETPNTKRSSSYPAYSWSRPYRPSSLSSMESSSDIGPPASPHTANTQNP
jgi:hypothetical protein